MGSGYLKAGAHHLECESDDFELFCYMKPVSFSLLNIYFPTGSSMRLVL